MQPDPARSYMFHDLVSRPFSNSTSLDQLKHSTTTTLSSFPPITTRFKDLHLPPDETLIGFCPATGFLITFPSDLSKINFYTPLGDLRASPLSISPQPRLQLSLSTHPSLQQMSQDEFMIVDPENNIVSFRCQAQLAQSPSVQIMANIVSSKSKSCATSSSLLSPSNNQSISSSHCCVSVSFSASFLLTLPKTPKNLKAVQLSALIPEFSSCSGNVELHQSIVRVSNSGNKYYLVTRNDEACWLSELQVMDSSSNSSSSKNNNNTNIDDDDDDKENHRKQRRCTFDGNFRNLEPALHWIRPSTTSSIVCNNQINYSFEPLIGKVLSSHEKLKKRRMRDYLAEICFVTRKGAVVVAILVEFSSRKSRQSSYSSSSSKSNAHDLLAFAVRIENDTDDSINVLKWSKPTNLLLNRRTLHEFVSNVREEFGGYEFPPTQSLNNNSVLNQRSVQRIISSKFPWIQISM